MPDTLPESGLDTVSNANLGDSPRESRPELDLVTISTDVTALRARKSEISQQLAGQTRGGIGLLDTITPWRGKIDEFSGNQRSLVEQVRQVEQQIDDKQKQLQSANFQVEVRKVDEETKQLTELLQSGKQDEADRKVLQIWGQFGGLTPPAVLQLLPAAYQRLHDQGRTLEAAPLQIGTSHGSSFDIGLAKLQRLGAADANAYVDCSALRQNALRAVDSSPELAKLVEGARTLSRDLPVLSDMFNSGIQGTKHDVFVKDARERAAKIEQAITQVEPHVPEIKAQLERLRQAESAAVDAKTKEALKERVRIFTDTVALFDPNSDTNKQLHRMFKTVQSSQFDENTWQNWMKKEGVLIGAAVGTAAAAVVTVCSFGVTSPLLIAATGATAALVGSEVAKESFYQINNNIGDTGWGTQEQSRLGALVANRPEYDSNGNERGRVLWDDVIAPYGTQVVRDTIISLATMGAGVVLARGINTSLANLGQSRATAFVMNNTQLFEKLNNNTRAATQAAAQSHDALAQRIVKQSADEFADEIKQASAEESLQAAFGRTNAWLGFVSGVLVATSKGVRINSFSAKHGELSISNESPQALVDIEQNMQKQGFQLTTDSSGARIFTDAAGNRMKLVVGRNEGTELISPPLELNPPGSGLPQQRTNWDEKQMWRRDELLVASDGRMHRWTANIDSVFVQSRLHRALRSFDEARHAESPGEAIDLYRKSIAVGVETLNLNRSNPDAIANAPVVAALSELRAPNAVQREGALGRYLTDMQRNAYFIGDIEMISQPDPLVTTSSGAYVSLIDPDRQFEDGYGMKPLASDDPKRDNNTREVSEFLHTPAGLRILAEQSMILMEENIIHPRQIKAGEIISPTYAAYVHSNAGNMSLSKDKQYEQEVPAMLYDAGMPIDLIEHHFGSQYGAHRSEIIDFIKQKSAEDATRPASYVAGLSPNAVDMLGDRQPSEKQLEVVKRLVLEDPHTMPAVIENLLARGGTADEVADPGYVKSLANLTKFFPSDSFEFQKLFELSKVDHTRLNILANFLNHQTTSYQTAAVVKSLLKSPVTVEHLGHDRFLFSLANIGRHIDAESPSFDRLTELATSDPTIAEGVEAFLLDPGLVPERADFMKSMLDKYTDEKVFKPAVLRTLFALSGQVDQTTVERAIELIRTGTDLAHVPQFLAQEPEIGPSVVKSALNSAGDTTFSTSFTGLQLAASYWHQPDKLDSLLQKTAGDVKQLQAVSDFLRMYSEGGTDVVEVALAQQSSAWLSYPGLMMISGLRKHDPNLLNTLTASDFNAEDVNQMEYFLDLFDAENYIGAAIADGRLAELKADKLNYLAHEVLLPLSPAARESLLAQLADGSVRLPDVLRHLKFFESPSVLEGPLTNGRPLDLEKLRREFLGSKAASFDDITLAKEGARAILATSLDDDSLRSLDAAISEQKVDLRPVARFIQAHGSEATPLVKEAIESGDYSRLERTARLAELFPLQDADRLGRSLDQPASARLWQGLRSWSYGENVYSAVQERLSNDSPITGADIDSILVQQQISRKSDRLSPSPLAGPDSRAHVDHADGSDVAQTAQIVRESADEILKQIPADRNIVLLGRDSWPLIPLLRAEGRDVQYFMFSRLQTWGLDPDLSTAEQWKKEVPPNSVVIDTGFNGTIFNAIRRIDPTIEGHLLSSNGGSGYPQLLAGDPDSVHAQVMSIETLPKLTSRGLFVTAGGTVITGRPNSDSGTSSDVHGAIKGNADLLGRLGLSPWWVWRFSNYTGLTPGERLLRDSERSAAASSK